MFKKELADVLKQTGWFLAAVAVIPIPVILLKWAPGPYFAVLMPILLPGLVFWSLFLGASLFGRERGQRAMEYALSFPYSRLGILARLAGPRLLVIAVLWLAAAAAAGIAASGTAVFNDVAIAAFKGKVPLAVVVLNGMLPVLAVALAFGFPLFLVALSVSVVIENFVALCLLSLFSWYAIGVVIFRLLWRFGSRYVDLPIPGMFVFPRPDVGAFRSEFSFPLVLLQLFLPVVPFVIALLVSFSRFDIRRSAGFIKRYITAFAASLFLCAFVAFLGSAASTSLASKYYHLTQNLKLVEWNYSSKIVRIRGNGSILKVHFDSPTLSMSWDDGSSLFVPDFDGNLNRIDLSTGKADQLYRFDRKQSAFWSQWTYGTTIAFFENGSRPNEIQLVCLDERTKKTDRRNFIHDAFRRGAPTLIGTDLRDGRRFWISLITEKSKKISLRLWEDGRVEEIRVKGQLESVNLPHDINGLLFFTGLEPTLVLQDNGKSFELRKEFPADETFHAWDGLFGRKSLDSLAVPFIYGKRGPKLARMNMATLEIEDIGEWSTSDDSWGYVFREKGRPYFVGGSRSRKTLEFYDLNEGRMRLIRGFANIDTQRRDTRFDTFESGIVIVKGKNVGVYAFPDLREIKY
jgi:hypothetical protein